MAERLGRTLKRAEPLFLEQRGDDALHYQERAVRMASRESKQ